MATQDEVKLIIKAATEQAVANLNKLNGAMDNTEKTGGRVSAGFSKLKSGWLAMTVAVGAATVAINKMTGSASNLEEAQNKFNETFKRSDTALKIANAGIKELNISYAMSKREAAALTSEIGALLIPMGYVPEEAAKASTEVVKLASDLGSFNNLPTEETLTAIRAALVGEYEPMRRLGVVLNEVVVKQEAANLGFSVGKGTLDGNAKAHAALSLIMKNTTLAQGDMIRTANGYANTQKRAQAAAEDMSAALGEVLLPAMTAIQSTIASGLGFIAQLSDGWRTTIVTIGLAGIAIAVLTKIVIAFGVSLSAAIWPITLIVAAIVGAIAIVKNWDTVLWALKVAWEAVKFGFEVAIQSIKVGMLWLSTQTGKVYEFLAQPFIDAINAVITQLNKLPGVNIKTLDNMFTKQTEHNEAMLELELEKLANMEMADVEHKTKIEEQEAKHQENLNVIKKGAADKEAGIYKDLGIKKLTTEQEQTIKFNEELKKRLKDQIKYKQTVSQIDTELLMLKIQNRGIDTQSLSSFWSFATGALDQNSKKQFKIWKAMSVASAIVTTAQAAINAYNSLVGIPYVGPVLGAAAAIVAGAFGLLQVNKIKNTQFQGAEEGALIRGTPGAYGTLIRAGENNKDEAIIPLEDSGLKMGTTVNIYNDTAIMDDEYPQSIAIKIDNALYRLKQNGLSKSL
jgi:hypothetical protein